MTRASEDLTAVILTYNEEIHIARCIERVRPIAGRIIVVDSYSTDRTIDIARSLGAEILQNRFVNHSVQFNWALQAARVTSGWILRIDADEWLEPAAAGELRERIANAPSDVSAFSFRLSVIFQGRRIRWGGYNGSVLTRVFRPGSARVEPRWMDELIEVTEGRIETIRRGHLVDENLRDLTFFTDKHNRYTTLQMVELIALEQPLLPERDSGALNRSSRRKRFLRNRLYARAPLYLRAFGYFFLRYFLRLGFLDGRAGLVFHFLQGCWNFVLMDAKVDEARRFIRRHGLEAFREHLAKCHNIDLSAAHGEIDRAQV